MSQMFDLTQLVGLAGVAIVRELVELIKPVWKESKASGFYSVSSSIIIAVVLNIALAVILKGTLEEAICIGIITGLLSNVWNAFVDMSKA